MSALEDDLGLSSLSSPSSSSSSSTTSSTDEKGRKEEEVDWSQGRGGSIGRVWRWRSGVGL